MKTNLKKSALMLLCAGAVVLTSCSKDENSDNPVAVQFSSSINQAAPTTKAAGAAWAPGDKIGVYMVAATPANNADNKQHNWVSGSVFTPEPGDEIYYPVNGENVDFIAYYPFSTAVSGMSYAVNVATQTSQPAIDLLWSNATDKNKTTGDNVALKFDHKLSKLIINTIPGAGLTASDLANMTIAIKGMNTTAAFDLSTGTLGTSATPAAIAPVAITMGSKYEAIVLPASFATAGGLKMEFTVGGDVFTWSSPANEAFEAGKQYTYDMTITRTGVNFTCTINDWDTSPNDRTGVAE